MPSDSEKDFARELVQSHRRVVRYFQRALPHEAEDLASDVLLAAWTASKGFRGDASVDTLAFRISSRVLWRRRKQLQRSSPLSLGHFEGLRDGEMEDTLVATDIADEGGAAANVTAAVKLAFSKLSPALARVVELSYLQGKTQREISVLLGLAPGTVASRLRRARDHLRAELAHLVRVAEERTSELDDQSPTRNGGKNEIWD